VRDVKAIEQRQNSEVDDPAAATESKSDVPTPSPSPSPSTPPKQSSEPPTPSPSPSPSTPPPPVKSSSSSTPVVTSETKKPPPGSPSSQQPPQQTESTDAPPPKTSEEVKTITHLSTLTYGDGSKSTVTSESLTTQTPGLAGGSNGGSGGSGMTPQTRNTVIGVVVGIGGAIILIGLGFVAWRIWGRKRNQDEQDGLMDYTSPNDGKSEVGGSMSGRTPFQSTLESYHAPTQVNQAANF